jgi:soluble lytic murein transglycosylase-like protein
MRGISIPAIVALAAAALPVSVYAVASPTAAASPAADRIAGLVADAARQFGIPEAWIWAVMRVESNGNIRATSPAGAMGLMQIMPATWARLRARYSLGDDVYDPRDNIMAGAAYLREMHDRYGSPGFLGAYNAGPGRYDDYVSRGRPLPRETVAYVTKLAPMIGSGTVGQMVTAPAPDPLTWTRAALFAARSTDIPGVSLVAVDTAADAPSGRSSSASRPVTLAVTERPANGLFVPLSGRSQR